MVKKISMRSTIAILVTLTTLAGMAGSSSPSAAHQQTPPLLYDWIPDGTPMSDIRAIDAQRYTLIRQDILPKRSSSGTVDSNLILAALKEKIPRSFNGWGALYVQQEFIDRLLKGLGHPDHEETSASLKQAILHVKQEWPGSKWTLLGCPSVAFWIKRPGENPVSWALATPVEKEREFARQGAAFAGLIDHVDWVSPVICDIHSAKAITKPSDQRRFMAAQKAWVKAKVALSKQLVLSRTNGPVPVIPMLCPAFGPGGNVKQAVFVPHQEFVEEVLQPTVELDVDGLSMWSGLHHWASFAFSNSRNPQNIAIRDQSRAMFKTLLFPKKPLDWNAPEAKTIFNDRIRPYLLDTLRTMRKAMRALPEDTPAQPSKSP